MWFKKELLEGQAYISKDKKAVNVCTVYMYDHDINVGDIWPDGASVVQATETKKYYARSKRNGRETESKIQLIVGGPYDNLEEAKAMALLIDASI